MEGTRERVVVGSNVPEYIKQKASEYEVLYLEAERLRKYVVSELAKVQEECEHEPMADMEMIRQWDPDYVCKIDTPLLMCGFNVFMARRCHLCGKEFPRKEGHPHRVCHGCGADMKEAGIGRNHGYNVYMSKCPQCGHVHELMFK